VLSSSTNSPKLLKGALVVYASHDPGAEAKIIPFQYNPDQVSRSLSQGGATAGTATGTTTSTTTTVNRGQAQQDVLRVQAPPRESFSLSVTLNAADQLEHPEQNQNIVQNGLHAVLATLEMLLYPTSYQVLQNESLAEEGEVQLNPANLPLVLLVWGRSRVVPVKISSFSVTEEAFDPVLNPIQAKLELGLLVLNYVDLPADSAGRDIYLSYQRQKETLAEQFQAGEEAEPIQGLLPN
jgi:phosphoribosyl-dephospho-CoA transferase